MKHVVVWGARDSTKRVIPVDEKYLADDTEAAKKVARDLLPAFREPAYLPQAVLEITEEKFLEMLTGTTPLETLNPDTPTEVEVLVIAD